MSSDSQMGVGSAISEGSSIGVGSAKGVGSPALEAVVSRMGVGSAQEKSSSRLDSCLMGSCVVQATALSGFIKMLMEAEIPGKCLQLLFWSEARGSMKLLAANSTCDAVN